MDKHEIVKRLEYCAENKCDICQKENGSGFPLIDGRCYGFTERLYDAIALLKAQDEKCRACGEKTNNAIQALQAELKSQEPRVIALEEMHRGMVAWLEDIDKPDVILAIGGSSCMGNKCFILENDKCIAAKDTECNVRWRAWTREPTKEQRKRIKWDDAH